MLHPGCHGDQNGNNGLWDIDYGSRALFLEDKQIYEKLNGGCAEFTNGNNFLTDQISFKIYDVMEYFDQKEELKNEMKQSLSGERGSESYSFCLVPLQSSGFKNRTIHGFFQDTYTYTFFHPSYYQAIARLQYR